MIVRSRMGVRTLGVRTLGVRIPGIRTLASAGLALAPVLGVAPRPVTAQSPGNAQPVINIMTDDPFYRLDRMDLPAPSAIRTADGRPGPGYWQQRVDYTINATLDTTAKTISGTVRIQYRNNSPDTLRYVWMQLDQNLYRPNSWGGALNPQDSRWGVRGFVGGYNLSSVKVDGSTVSYDVSDTRMRVSLARPIAPKGGTATIVIAYSFQVPEHGSDRMGRDGTLYEIAQWYPRMAVYDDIRGWNTDPYLGQGEFYLEYGDIDYSVTLPAGFTVAGSGVLQNPTQVLTAQQRARLAKAATSTKVVPIITKDEAVARSTSGTKTWHFAAKSVRDVAWAAAPDFRWDAVSTGAIEGNARGVLCQAYYQFAKAGTAWESGAENTQFTIRNYSDLVIPFPYPQATSVAGPVAGMEYPMFQMTGYGAPNADSNGVFGTIDHEHGHEWFPMLVGSNERRYTWMDEGFNTYINAFNLEKRGLGDQWSFYMQNWRRAHDLGIDVPLMTAPDHVNPGALGAIGYRKPGAVMLALRNHVVGRQTFDAAFRSYAKTWMFKHPTPADFFRTIENYAGMDLSWYWRSFWYSTAVLDIGIDSVQQAHDAANNQYALINLHNVTGVPFPVELRVQYASGKTSDLKLPVEVWDRTGRLVYPVAEVNDQVVGVRLWPDPTVPDWDANNDTWGKAPAADPIHSVVR